jgi:cytochrome c553
VVEVPLPWERLLWTCRTWPWLPFPRAARYVLTDFRLVLIAGRMSDEIALQDVGVVQYSQSWLERLLGVSTLVVGRRDGRGTPFRLHRVPNGPELAALVEFLAGDPHASLDADAVRAALRWEPRASGRGVKTAIAAAAFAFIAVFAVAIKLSGTSASISYPSDDEIYPRGEKKSREEIARYMETAVLPWARQALAPIVGVNAVTCATCHGADAQARAWQMPSVAALPEPIFRGLAWEHSGVAIDAQLRNAIYGYSAESDNEHKAAYMRQVVMPGMARLLHRPAYDFSRSYDYNRSRFALGCYHCHRVN